MTLELVITREATMDIADAITWLRDVSPALPAGFEEELEKTYSSILRHPRMHQIVYKKFRRALLHRFPYSVFYVVEPPILLVVGVVHQARDESTWKRRT